MRQNNYTTEIRKYKHLNYVERTQIERWYNKEKRSKAEIAILLRKSERTIRREINRGKVKNLTTELEEIWVYSADVAEQKYRYEMTGKGPQMKLDNDREFVKYIEVKSTKRLTAPNIEDDLWIDTLNITRNEWIAAQQHRDFYSIFRVYFTRKGITMFILKNPMQKYSDNKLQVTPMTYRLDFSNTAVDSVVSGL